MIPHAEYQPNEGDDPRAAIAAEKLSKWVANFFAGRSLDPATCDEVQAFVDHRVRMFKERGIDFPRMAALMFPRFGSIKLYRRDLDEKSIRQAIVNATREFPEVTPYEIATAIAFAFPEYMKKVAN
jgi:hypothetical protein